MTLPLTRAQMERYIYLLMQSERVRTEWEAVRDYRAYYSGDHPSLLTRRQEQYLGQLLTAARHVVTFNVCRPVVDIPLERLRVTGFSGMTDEDDNPLRLKVAEWWRVNDMDTVSIEVHRRALRDGASYLIVDWDADAKRPLWVCHPRYDGDTGVSFHLDPNTNTPQMAFRYWRVNDPLGNKHGQRRRTVYLPDRILRFKEDTRAEYGWSPVGDDEGPALQWWTDTLSENGKPLGLAVVEFANAGRISEIEDVIGLQNAITKTLLDLIAATDLQGFAVLALSYPGPAGMAGEQTDESTIEDLPWEPGRALELFDGATAQRIPPGDTEPIVNTFKALLYATAAAAGIPYHFLWQERSFDEIVSGEALRTIEARLIAKVKERQRLFGSAWLRAMRLGAMLWSILGDSAINAQDALRIEWSSAVTRNEFIDAQVAQLHANLGVPREHLWQHLLGYSAEEVRQFKRMAEIARSDAVLDQLFMSGGNGGRYTAEIGVDANTTPAGEELLRERRPVPATTGEA